MSRYFLPETELDPFEHHSASHDFVAAAKFALDHYGDAHIPRDTLIDLQHAHGLPDSEVPALAYLAQNRVSPRTKELAL